MHNYITNIKCLRLSYCQWLVTSLVVVMSLVAECRHQLCHLINANSRRLSVRKHFELYCTVNWSDHRYNIKYSLDTTGQSNSSQRRGHDRLPNWNPKNGGMLISQPISSCLTNHSELCMSRPRNNQSRRISIYTLQRRPSFGFESSVSSTSMTSGDPVARTVEWLDPVFAH